VGKKIDTAARAEHTPLVKHMETEKYQLGLLKKKNPSDLHSGY